MTPGQLSLLEPIEPIECERTVTAADAGVATNITDGRARLLAALVKRGLEREHLPTAARLILAWDAHAPVDEDYRLCSCGCGRVLDGRRANTKYFDDACRSRALRARKASAPTPTPKTPFVTSARLPTGLRQAA